ncbi:MAG: hypothetical protein FWH27_09100 [Planctomycetaceae bacterium]|nr:hypothetical protein [Planctomycetaceae bacterium]
MSDTQLDKHSIAIRKRSVGELFNLTLVVLRTEGLRVFGWFAVFVIPLTLINHALLTWLTESVFVLDAEEEAWSVVYFFGYAGLVALETPFASSAALIYLGKRVFAADVRPSKTEVLVAWVEALPQLILYTIFLLPLILVYDCLPEIVVLERSPLVRGRKDQITTFRRLKNFHRDRFGEQFVVLLPLFWFGVILVPTLGLVVTAIFYLCVGPIEKFPALFCAIQAPVVCWTVTLFLLVFHFLRYIDMRIEREGWDVELVFRAERSRMTGGE